MTDQEKDKIVEFHRGYDDGVKGREFDDGHDTFVQFLTLGFAGNPRENSEEYSDGYYRGKDDLDNRKK